MISAPCHESSSTNSSDDCISRSSKYKGADDLSRILTRLNTSTHGKSQLNLTIKVNKLKLSWNYYLPRTFALQIALAACVNICILHAWHFNISFVSST